MADAVPANATEEQAPKRKRRSPRDPGPSDPASVTGVVPPGKTKLPSGNIREDF